MALKVSWVPSGSPIRAVEDPVRRVIVRADDLVIAALHRHGKGHFCVRARVQGRSDLEAPTNRGTRAGV
jgi:hypothetical protein